MSEVLGLDINTDLVVLSACNTAGEKPNQGEGFVGLTRSFLYAGTRRLLVSHWSVGSESTRDLMVATFTQLQAGQHPARRPDRGPPPVAEPDLAAGSSRLRFPRPSVFLGAVRGGGGLNEGHFPGSAGILPAVDWRRCPEAGEDAGAPRVGNRSPESVWIESVRTQCRKTVLSGAGSLAEDPTSER